MSDTFTEKQVYALAKYIKKKERMMIALNTSIANYGGVNTIYGSELNEILIMVYEDRLPGSLNLQKSMPELYPALQQQKEKKEEDKEEADE
jgi:hypothetical protein